MIKVPTPVNRSVHCDQLNRAVIIINSAIELGIGGSARLARLAISHQVVIKGSAICRPRARTIVRLCVRS